KSYVNENNLDDCVYLLGRLPLGMMPTLYLKADLMLLTLKDSYIFELTVPARMQSYLALGKPVLAMINGEAANIIKEYNCGYVCKAGDIERAANIVSTLDRTDLNQKGDNAKYCYYSCFRKIDQLNKLAQLFESRN
ncbi:MAG: glycosyltransferase family 4 protein, partial [Tannerellaceae bacterium]